ncbi:NACHT domain-containing NTPase [Nostoc sp. C052]|uniref:NACHT domain-containing protein n=1 Tax=Nostoc sp. C052 TaxID=2576902 RepID=UPI0015C34A54|nr:NACHT domain-containing NTPase [Nostoc sp. C052]QLE42250.1 NACHT domain-containing NTPase [Nostoc sp. C052]
MPQNSLRACPAGIKKAKTALTGKGWSQQQLARELEISRQPVDNFFGAKPISNDIFVKICQKLELDWQELIGRVQAEEQEAKTLNINALVQQVREKVRADIQKRCGWIRVLDMTQPLRLNNIYTDVNILEKITGRQNLELSQLLENCNPANFERFGLSHVLAKRVPGLEAIEQYSKLMILGKPGAGKTTFLKRIAMQCNSERFLADCVPIFITLKEFAEEPKQPSLLHYINHQLARHDISDKKIAETLLRQGRAILLLDGLDEVRQADHVRVLNEIRNFSTQYDANSFVMTCRIAANEYKFEHFTEVEIADFDDQQITDFVTRWFQNKDSIKAQKLIQKLQENQRIKELATNPLLLTLLCLLFGESTNFPSNRSELYQEGIDVLLKKWDGMRSIERDQVYQKLSHKRKADLLSQIALETFEEGNYFFKERLVEGYISNYIQNLPDAKADPQAILLDSIAVLKSIEAQHGLLVERAKRIYSFSHLTFHEFFTARYIAFSRNPQQVFQQLVSHITDNRWREVFLLTVGILTDADDLLLLMKQRIDVFLTGDEKLLQFLIWVNEKSRSVESLYKSSAVRAFYVYLKLAQEFNLERDLTFFRNLDRDLAFDLTFALKQTHNSEFQCKLQKLQNQLPNPEGDLETYERWWQKNGQTWDQRLRAVMVEHGNICQNWEFSNSQQELLKHYYNGNLLLIDCLNSECYVSREVRQQIEDTLLLPVKTTNPE